MNDDAAIEGREFLKIITEVDPDIIDDEDRYPDYAIEAWLEEMGFEFNGQSWMAI